MSRAPFWSLTVHLRESEIGPRITRYSDIDAKSDDEAIATAKSCVRGHTIRERPARLHSAELKYFDGTSITLRYTCRANPEDWRPAKRREATRRAERRAS